MQQRLTSPRFREIAAKSRMFSFLKSKAMDISPVLSRMIGECPRRGDDETEMVTVAMNAEGAETCIRLIARKGSRNVSNCPSFNIRGLAMP
jgi:hypothetical protein